MRELKIIILGDAGDELKALSMVGKHSITELHPSCNNFIFILKFRALCACKH